MGYVLVDEEACAGALIALDEILKVNTERGNTGAARLMQQLMAGLAPVVLELPEGAKLVAVDDPHAVAVTYEGQRYGVDEFGLHCLSDREYGIDHDVIPFLLSRWNALQGGGE